MMIYNQAIPGFLDIGELERLAQWAKERIPEHGLAIECGSCAGRSSFALGVNMPASARLYCFDRFGQQTIMPLSPDQAPGTGIDATGQLQVGQYVNFLELFRANLKDLPNVFAQQCEMPRDFSNFIPYKTIDFFFLDLEHTNPQDIEVINYFSQWFGPQTFICGHDYSPDQFPDVVSNVHELAQRYNVGFTVYSPGNLWHLSR